MTRRIRGLSSLAGYFLAGSMAFGANAEPLTIRLHGSNTLGSKLGPSLLEAYARQQGFVGVDRTETAELEFRISGRRADGSEFVGVVKAHGTNTGRADLMSGAADVWMASRAATADEVASGKAIGDLNSPEQEHIVALDGLAIIVHPDNLVTQLRVDQIRDAFAGRIVDWAQLGGKAGPIKLYGRDDQSGTWDSFKSMVLSDGAALSAATRRFESSSELEELVAADTSAIGFVGFSYIAGSRPLSVLANGTLALKPTALSVSTEDYLLARRLYFYTAGDAGKHVQDFIEFVQGNEGQSVVADTGFVSQNIFVAQAEPVPGNPDQYYDVIGDAERLSMNFRFRPASATLDSRALRDIERLSQFMRLPENKTRQVRLAAFSPGASRTPMMTLLTLNDRVDHISQLLSSRGVRINMGRGFVDGAIVAPLDRPEGRARNERVEVWLVDPHGGLSGDQRL
jgi:phosphate transport system substrate-binding protein